MLSIKLTTYMINYSPWYLKDLAVDSAWLDESSLYDVLAKLEDNKVPAVYRGNTWRVSEVFLVAREDFAIKGEWEKITHIFVAGLQICFHRGSTPIKVFFNESSPWTIIIHGVEFNGGNFERISNSKLQPQQIKLIVESILLMDSWELLKPKELTIIEWESKPKDSVDDNAMGNEKDVVSEEEHINSTYIDGNTIYYYFTSWDKFYRYVAEFEIEHGIKRKAHLLVWDIESWNNKIGFVKKDLWWIIDLHTLRSQVSIAILRELFWKYDSLNNVSNTSPALYEGRDDSRNKEVVGQHDEVEKDESPVNITKCTWEKYWLRGELTIYKWEKEYSIEYSIKKISGDWGVVSDDTVSISIDLSCIKPKWRNMNNFPSQDILDIA